MRALGEPRPVMRFLQLDTIAEANRTVPRRTGFLQRSIGPGAITDTTAEVIATAPYAAAIEFGRRAIDIYPKRAKVLAWGGARRLSGNLRSGASATNFAAHVHQDARPAKPYLVPAAKKAAARIGDIIVTTWNRAA